MPRRAPIGSGELFHEAILLTHMLHSDTMRYSGSLTMVRYDPHEKNATGRALFTHIIMWPRRVFGTSRTVLRPMLLANESARPSPVDKAKSGGSAALVAESGFVGMKVA